MASITTLNGEFAYDIILDSYDVQYPQRPSNQRLAVRSLEKKVFIPALLSRSLHTHEGALVPDLEPSKAEIREDSGTIGTLWVGMRVSKYASNKLPNPTTSNIKFDEGAFRVVVPIVSEGESLDYYCLVGHASGDGLCTGYRTSHLRVFFFPEFHDAAAADPSDYLSAYEAKIRAACQVQSQDTASQFAGESVRLEGNNATLCRLIDENGDLHKKIEGNKILMKAQYRSVLEKLQKSTPELSILNIQSDEIAQVSEALFRSELVLDHQFLRAFLVNFVKELRRNNHTSPTELAFMVRDHIMLETGASPIKVGLKEIDARMAENPRKRQRTF